MPLADQATGTHALDMCGYSLAACDLQIVCAGHRKAVPEKPDFRTRTLRTTMRRNSGAASQRLRRPVPTTPPTTSTAPPVHCPGHCAYRLSIVSHYRGRAVGKSADYGNRTIRIHGPHLTLMFRSPGRDVVYLLTGRDYTGLLASLLPFSESPLSVLHTIRSARKNPHAGAPCSVSAWESLGCECLARLTGKRILRGLALSSLIACVLLVSSCAGIPVGAEASAEIIPGSYSRKPVVLCGFDQASTVAEITICRQDPNQLLQPGHQVKIKINFSGLDTKFKIKINCVGQECPTDIVFSQSDEPLRWRLRRLTLPQSR